MSIVEGRMLTSAWMYSYNFISGGSLWLGMYRYMSIIEGRLLTSLWIYFHICSTGGGLWLGIMYTGIYQFSVLWPVDLGIDVFLGFLCVVGLIDS